MSGCPGPSAERPFPARPPGLPPVPGPATDHGRVGRPALVQKCHAGIAMPCRRTGTCCGAFIATVIRQRGTSTDPDPGGHRLCRVRRTAARTAQAAICTATTVQWLNPVLPKTRATVGVSAAAPPRNGVRRAICCRNVCGACQNLTTPENRIAAITGAKGRMPRRAAMQSGLRGLVTGQILRHATDSCGQPGA